MANLEEAKDAVGELIVSGFSGLDLSDETSAFFSQAKIGGVILFSQNCDSPAQLSELINGLQQSAPNSLPRWIAIDHEGGRVQRLKKPFTKLPSAADVGRIDSPKLAFELSEMVARELKAVGINLNLAPVADIATQAKFLAERSFGREEEVVSKMVTAWVRGHVLNHVWPCAKHFPGHGESTQDSHDILPRVKTPLEVLRDRELKPFVKAFKSKCPFVMSAHLVYEQIDPDHPATFSSKILREILRKDIRYSKLVISDDLEMKAITQNFDAKEVPSKALIAGCDLLLYKTENAARTAWKSLQDALDSGTLSPELVMEAVKRVRTVKKELLTPYKPVDVASQSGVIGSQAHEELVQKFV
jgi:beta-N-acetylhexosaminidase